MGSAAAARHHHGWRKSWKRHREIQTKGRLQVCQGWTSVPCWKDPSSSEEQELQQRPCWSHRCCLQLRHPGRRGVGHSDQGHHRWRWSHPPHPQVSHRKEGRGWSCSSVIADPCNVNISTVPMYLI